MNQIDSSVLIESPGRINLIGEHIDYNGGFVLPAAINYHIHFQLKSTNSSVVYIKSIDFDDELTVDIHNIQPSEKEWANYILGVLKQIQDIKPEALSGFDCFFESNLPIGSGMSSSAALECGIAKGVNELFSIGLSDEEIIKLSQKAEHEYVGTMCGIMDQFAVVKGKSNHFILLNCQTLEYEYVPSELSPYTLLMLNSNVKHSLSTSEYNTRREECNKALEAINRFYPEYTYLVDVPIEVVDEFKNKLPENIYNRLVYVVQENQRVLQVAKALEQNNLEQVGQLLYQTHHGLQYLYEVSCEELDFMVDYSKQFDEVLGSRLMGGGFGGCTINLIKADFVDNYIERISAAYKDEFDIDLTPIKIFIENGVTTK